MWIQKLLGSLLIMAVCFLYTAIFLIFTQLFSLVFSGLGAVVAIITILVVVAYFVKVE